jgi:rhodanese-related sulfurtransferase
MKTRTLFTGLLILILSLMLAACGSPEETPDPTMAPDPTAVPAPTDVAPEPTAVPEPEPEPTELTEAELDAAVTAFLGNMVAYNTIGLEPFNELLIENPPFILDVRQPNELEERGHIEGAVHIPLRELGANLDKLPSFDTPIVSYCGVGWRCTIAMTGLGALGFTNVKALVGGSFGGWVENGYGVVPGLAPEAASLNAISPDPLLAAHVEAFFAGLPDGWGVVTPENLALELVEKPEMILIDVRRAEELETGGIIESDVQANIPLEQLIASKSDWPADKDAEIVIYCGTGHRSTIAMSIMWQYGYTNVRSMKGGINGWKAAGYPVLGGTEAAGPDLDAAFATFLDNMVAYNTIRPAALNELLVEDPPPFILDVRQPAELEERGHIEGAVHIPLRELGANLDKLPSFDTPIVSYCGVGWRCTIAMTALGAMGWTDVKALVGGSFGGWVNDGYPVIEGPALEAPSLNAASPDPALAAVLADMLANLPDGWGVITVDGLATELIDKPDMLLIDVRTVAEVEENGRIESEGQLLIPIQEFITRMGEWPDSDAEIVIYCGTGHRSTIAMTILKSYGYSNVRSMKGGTAEWINAGYPVVEYAAP